jgi:murein DD-endopeptidase MepM/ murein hydrolase activator NlpD
MLPAAVPVPATASSSSYEDVIARLERARRLVREAEQKERGLRRSIASTSAEQRAVSGELSDLAAVVRSAQGRLTGAEEALGQVQAELDVKTAQLEAALQELQATHDLFEARVVRVYMDGPGSTLDLLFGARSWREFVSRLQLVDHVLTGDRMRLRKIARTKDRIATERIQIAELREQAAAEVERVMAERNRLAQLQDSVQQRERALSRELQGQQASLQNVQQQKETYLRQQRELEAESGRIAAFLRGRNGGVATVTPGGMLWPASGPVTSGYGWRTHPIYGSRRFHSGIDIGSPSGAPATASAAGEVIFTGQKGGYGNTVMVDHGGGVVTLYAHLSSISRGVGATVGGGQTVGRVGCTGYCTGPHLHFEVRVNGDTQNPLRWLR